MKKAKKILAMVLSALLLMSLTVVGTLAYLTSKTDPVTNTFTVGAIQITLDEAKAIKGNGDNYVAEGDTADVTSTGRVTNNTYDLHPGIVAIKDPTIHIKKGSEDCYVVAKIVVTANDMTKLRAQLGYENSNGLIGFEGILTGGVLAETFNGTTTSTAGATVWQNSNVILTQQTVDTDTDKSNVFYVYCKKEWLEDTAADQHYTLFNQISIPQTWDSTALSALDGLNIEVSAYAVQSDGFTDVVDAFKAAFATEYAVAAPVIG